MNEQSDTNAELKVKIAGLKKINNEKICSLDPEHFYFDHIGNKFSAKLRIRNKRNEKIE